MRRQATSLEGSEKDVRQSQKVRHVGVKALFEYVGRVLHALFPSKLDAQSRWAQRRPRGRARRSSKGRCLATLQPASHGH